MQFRRELGPRRTCADDRDLQLLRPQRPGLCVPTDVGIHQAAWKRFACPGVSSDNRVLAHAGRAEIIALAADRDDQRVVMKAPRRRDLLALVVDMGSK